MTSTKNLRARRQPVRSHVRLDFAHQDLFAMKYTGCERGRTLGGVENVGEVFGASRTGRGDDGNAHRVRHQVYELVIEAVSLAVLVDAVQKNLSRTESLHGDGELIRTDIATFASTLHGALEPHILFSVRARARRFHALVLRHRWIGDVLPARVNRNHHRLHAVTLGDLFYARLARVHLARCVPIFGDVHGIASDRHLVGAARKVRARHLERGVRLAVAIGEVTNAPTNRERHEYGFTRATKDL
mmetsp:Transcript_5128/g.19855  ORF Transcript_5128/g.19855 Transcript_5128/m.19855 type:complete len:244 (+) Transcript_5128:38-769(+)